MEITGDVTFSEDNHVLNQLDDLMKENLVMYERSSKMKSTSLVKIVNPYQSQNRKKHDIEVIDIELEEQVVPVVEFISPSSRGSKRSVVKDSQQKLQNLTGYLLKELLSCILIF